MQTLRRAWAREWACGISTREAIIIAALVCLAAFTFFWRLGEGSLFECDEARHAQEAREMIWHRDLLTPHWDGVPRLTKPPLHFWQTIAAFKVFGDNEFAARFPSALASVGAVLMTYLLGRALFDRATGLGAALLLLVVRNHPYSYYYNFVSVGRMSMLTAPLAFYALAAIWLAWRGEKDRRYLIFIGLPVGAAAMTKNVASLMPAASLVLYWLLTRKLRDWPWRELALALALFAAIALPWHVAQALAHTETFVQEYVLFNVVQRVTADIDESFRSYSTWFHLDTIRKGFSYLWPALPLAALLAGYRALARRERAPLLLLTWALVPVAAYTAAQTKLPWYVLEAYPPLALLAAWLLVRVPGRPWGLALIVAFMVAFGWRVPSPRDDAPLIKRVAGAVPYLAGKDDMVLICMANDDYTRPTSLYYARRPLQYVDARNMDNLLRARAGARFLLTDTSVWPASGLQGEIVCQAGKHLLVRFAGP